VLRSERHYRRARSSIGKYNNRASPFKKPVTVPRPSNAWAGFFAVRGGTGREVFQFFEIADCAVVGNLFDIVPVLIEEVKKASG
jgi:hypothetical protein